MEIKLIASLVLVLAVAASVFFGCRGIYNAGRTAGRAEVQLTFDNFKADVAKAASDQAEKNATEAAAAALHDRETHDAYEIKLAAARADAADYAGRMFNALARVAASARTAAQVQGGPGPAPAGGPKSDGGARQLSKLLADAHTECLANDDRLDALVVEVIPQVTP